MLIVGDSRSWREEGVGAAVGVIGVRGGGGGRGVWLECGRGAGRSADHSLFFFRVGVRGFESWGFRGYDGRIRKEDGDL